MSNTARRIIGISTLGVTAALGVAGTAAACGGLVGENGTIQLVRTTTLAAYSDGIERYVTAFEFTGEGEEVGSIIPLPGVPTEVESAAATGRCSVSPSEVAPPAPVPAADGASPTRRRREVLLEVEIDALDITVLRGGGDEVGEWAVEHGFLLTPTPRRCSTSTLAAAPCSWRPGSTPSGPPSSARRPATAHRSWPRSPPTIRGCRCASSDSGPRTTSASRPMCSCSPMTSPTCSPAAPG